MTRKFKKKIRKKRGTRTVGYGRVGQHRKKGQRAGAGKTTQWKKSKKSLYFKQKKLGFPDPDWRFGKKGFKRPQKINRIEKVNAINVKDLEFKLDKFIENNIAEKSGEIYSIDLSKINVQKLIGKGEISKKVSISVNKASERAVKKIETAGGKVVLLEK